MHGKACKHDDLIMCKHGLSGKNYTSKVCNPRTSGPTAGELTQRNIFKQASDYAKNTMLNSAKRTAAENRYKAAKEAGTTKYLTLRTFLMGESFNGAEVA